MTLKNKTYDILKLLCTIILPIIATILGTAGQIWDIPYYEEIVLAVTALATCIGTIVSNSSKKYAQGIVKGVANYEHKVSDDVCGASNGYIMTGQEFADKAKWIATDLTTLYAQGGIGQPGWDSNKKYLINQYSYNKQREDLVNSLPVDGFFFDCVCLVKSILWGFTGDANQIYGGAVYSSNGVPDVGTENMLNYCTEVSSDFSNIPVGAYLHMKGHAGIYIGNGLGVECTPIWGNNVQISAVGNIGTVAGYPTRTWEDWGSLKWVEYAEPEPPKPVISWSKGDKVTLNKDAKIYGKTSKFQDWVYETVLTVMEDSVNDRAVIGTDTNPVIGAVYTYDLTIYEKEQEPDEPIIPVDSEGNEPDDTDDSLITKIILMIVKLIQIIFKRN